MKFKKSKLGALALVLALGFANFEVGHDGLSYQAAHADEKEEASQKGKDAQGKGKDKGKDKRKAKDKGKDKCNEEAQNKGKGQCGNAETKSNSAANASDRAKERAADNSAVRKASPAEK